MSNKPDSFAKKPVVLMNMISSEQEMAWNAQKCPFHLLITSGILVSQHQEYLQFATKNNLQILQTHEKHGWLCYILKENL